MLHYWRSTGCASRTFLCLDYPSPFGHPSRLPRGWICLASLRTTLHPLGALVFMAHKCTIRRGFILSSRRHAVRTWRTAHRFHAKNTCEMICHLWFSQSSNLRPVNTSPSHPYIPFSPKTARLQFSVRTRRICTFYAKAPPDDSAQSIRHYIIFTLCLSAQRV
jgi:hypothetical protein